MRERGTPTRRAYLAVGLALSLAHCTHRAPRIAAPAQATTTLRRPGFEGAIADAMEATPAERSSRLLRINNAEPRLTWDDVAGHRRVLMVTWTNWPGYDGHEGTDVPLTREMWVTAVPEVRDFCARLGTAGEPLATRLRQYLGLRPDSRKDRFVEVWVDPVDLFRPCPDPEIDDATCELDFPASAPSAHREWFARLRGSSYGESGYPWTRLGYTYDWGNEHGVIGASEFVVRSSASVEVRAVTPTDAYCTASR